MAPLTSTPTPTTMANLAPTLKPEGQDFAGDEFSNNLFSDLAPLLTLFGEQVTKQFLSMSLGWADSILLAMGPLGILTTVVSAIRVGGVKNLKSLVGRARESLAIAEQELLSSTSDNVCEMWSGTDIVRQLGKPKTKELILVKTLNLRKPYKVIDLTNAIEYRHMYENDKEWPFSPTDKNIPSRLASQAPNIALNLAGNLAPKRELWCWAIVGIVLQLTAIVFPALATYFWKFSKADSNVQDYAYPCFTAGTLAIVFGVILCSHVIEGVTDERTYEPEARRVLQVTRLQLACTVSDQSFQPYLIMNPPNDKRIRTSRRLDMPGSRLSRLAAFASILTVAGFICQFVGLRGLHWSATIFQLGVTLIMTGARSWVRRGLAAKVPCVKLKPKYELNMTALLLFANSSQIPSDICNDCMPKWRIITGRGLQLSCKRQETPTVETENPLPNFTESVFSLQQGLAKIMPNTTNGDEISQMMSKLVASMSNILDCYEKAIKDRLLQVNLALPDRKKFEWSHGVLHYQEGEWKYARVSCGWEKAMPRVNMTQVNANQSQLESILRFSMFACDEEPSIETSMVVIGYGDLQKRNELEVWLPPTDPLYDIKLIPIHSLQQVVQRGENLFDISTLPFPLTPIDGSEYFFAYTRRKTLLHKYALEIFSGFMDSLTKSIGAVGGSTKLAGTFIIKRSSEGDCSVDFKENSVLMLFSQALVDSGLVKTIEAAKPLIIPPFANRGLLPTECGEITFPEPVWKSSKPSSGQTSSTVSPESAKREPADQDKQANILGTSKETAEDKEKTESRLESVTKGEFLSYKNEKSNEGQEELSKDGPVAHSLHSGRSDPEAENDSKGEKKQE